MNYQEKLTVKLLSVGHGASSFYSFQQKKYFMIKKWIYSKNQEHPVRNFEYCIMITAVINLCAEHIETTE